MGTRQGYSTGVLYGSTLREYSTGVLYGSTLREYSTGVLYRETLQGATPVSITTFSITTLSLRGSYVDTQHKRHLA